MAELNYLQEAVAIANLEWSNYYSRLEKEVAAFGNDREKRLHACKLASESLSHYPNPDPRAMKAIKTAMGYANGLFDNETLEEAKRDIKELVPSHPVAHDYELCWICCWANATNAVREAIEIFGYEMNYIAREKAHKGKSGIVDTPYWRSTWR